MISKNNKCHQICSEQSDPALLSAGKLCDDRCVAAIDKEKCIAHKDKPVIKAAQCTTTGIHAVNLNNLLQVEYLKHANL